ncbi:hypothetical protein [Pseudomonas amygdali]|uniref:hypothetical protein n=1 Tax=Pseudomonas amygdali TaxID=47877 RepID=UPI0011C38578|nr:hypothetical protein [Pseudomonas amygdali]
MTAILLIVILTSTAPTEASAAFIYVIYITFSVKIKSLFFDVSVRYQNAFRAFRWPFESEKGGVPRVRPAAKQIDPTTIFSSLETTKPLKLFNEFRGVVCFKYGGEAGIRTCPI